MLDRRNLPILSVGFVCMVALYLSPLLVDQMGGFGAGGERLHDLYRQSLQNDVVIAELLRFVVSHLVLLLVIFFPMAFAARTLSAKLRVRSSISLLLVIFLTWVAFLLFNSHYFPLSGYARFFEGRLLRWLGYACGGALLLLLLAATVESLGRLASRASLANGFRHKHVFFGRLALVAFAFVLPLAAMVTVASGAHNVAVRERAVILVGVDSLSWPLLMRYGEEFPNILKFQEHSIRFDKAFTPMARTHPAWLSALSGKPPAEHGAVLNLRRADKIGRDELLTWALKESGYRTVHAIDERRFSNMDESYGFDVIVGPKAGALDFVLQTVTDNPLANLILQTNVGRYFFPYSHLNVAAHASYDAVEFVSEAVRAMEGAGSAFLAIHFESAHFPFVSRHAASVADDGDLLARHIATLKVVDRQIAHLMSLLKQEGWLNDALVILFSDHGEAFGEVESVTTQNGSMYEIVGYGHGANLLSRNENQIVLSASRFRHGEPYGENRRIRDLHSLSAIRGLVEKFAEHGRLEAPQPMECITLETGIRLVSAADYTNLDPRQVANEGAGFYELDDSGRLVVRERRLLDLLGSKDVALRCEDRIVLYSSRDQSYFSYRLHPESGEILGEVDVLPGDVATLAQYRILLSRSAQ